MNPYLTRNRQYQRKAPSRDAKKVYIFCEDDREVSYFKYFSGISSNIDIIPIGNKDGDSAKIGENVDIAPNVYIGHDVVIGNNVKIFPNVTIGEGAIIGDGTVIYSNVSIREFVEIGKNCVIQPGAVIG